MFLRSGCVFFLIIFLGGCNEKEGAIPFSKKATLFQTKKASSGEVKNTENITETIKNQVSERGAYCSTEKIKEILAPATSSSPTVRIDCSFDLTSSDVVTKSLLLEGTSARNIKINCNGATIDTRNGNPINESIQIISKKNYDANNKLIGLEPPKDITIKNCKIFGSIRIIGLAGSGEGVDLRDSSRKDAFHTIRAQNSAPSNIVLDNITITGNKRIPLYIAPGSTFVTLKNSEITGNSNSTAIYLDAESGNNSIINNYIHPSTARELIAVDASAYNLIQGNMFSSLEHGGIYLYRNCGEGGTIRHQTPSHNKILDNKFYYKKYIGISPGVHIASRMGLTFWFCNSDKGYPWGSSSDNMDNAKDNVVAYNYFTSGWFNIPILNTGNSTNKIIHNSTVKKFPSVIRYSCFEENSKVLLKSGDSFIQKIKTDTQCFSVKVQCTEGSLSYINKINC